MKDTVFWKMALKSQVYLPNVISFHAKNKRKIDRANLAKLCSFKVKGFRNIAKTPQVLYTLQKKQSANAKIVAKPNTNSAVVSEIKSKIPLVKKRKTDEGLKTRKSRVRLSTN